MERLTGPEPKTGSGQRSWMRSAPTMREAPPTGVLACHVLILIFLLSNIYESLSLGIVPICINSSQKGKMYSLARMSISYAK